MNANKRIIVVIELLLIFPAALFMTALIVRYFPSAQAAQQIVLWYAGRMWTLWILLIALPLAALTIGCVTLLPSRGKNNETQAASRSHSRLATLIIAVATVAAGGILAVVAVHMLMN